VWGGREVHISFWEGNLEEEQGLEVETVLRVGLEEIRWKGVEWTDLAEGSG
jgi:hypothetical protein